MPSRTQDDTNFVSSRTQGDSQRHTTTLFILWEKGTLFIHWEKGCADRSIILMIFSAWIVIISFCIIDLRTVLGLVLCLFSFGDGRYSLLTQRHTAWSGRELEISYILRCYLLDWTSRSHPPVRRWPWCSIVQTVCLPCSSFGKRAALFILWEKGCGEVL